MRSFFLFQTLLSSLLLLFLTSDGQVVSAQTYNIAVQFKETVGSTTGCSSTEKTSMRTAVQVCGDITNTQTGIGWTAWRERDDDSEEFEEADDASSDDRRRELATTTTTEGTRKLSGGGCSCYDFCQYGMGGYCECCSCCGSYRRRTTQQKQQLRRQTQRRRRLDDDLEDLTISHDDMKSCVETWISTNGISCVQNHVYVIVQDCTETPYDDRD